MCVARQKLDVFTEVLSSSFRPTSLAGSVDIRIILRIMHVARNIGHDYDEFSFGKVTHVVPDFHHLGNAFMKNT